MSILREVTQERHQAVEDLPFTQYLLHGGITREHYVIYLAEMLEIYRHLESLALSKQLLDDLPELPRTHRIAQDLLELDPHYQHQLTASSQRYLQYLTDLADSQRYSDLFAHIYVRHLGDMYGGKLIARRVPGSGQWYEFDNRADLVKRFTAKITPDLADEALTAFDWFHEVFQDLWQRIHTA